MFFFHEEAGYFQSDKKYAEVERMQSASNYDRKSQKSANMSRIVKRQLEMPMPRG